MKKINTFIETMQLEIVEASAEIIDSTKCYNSRLFLDVSEGNFLAYPNPQEALAEKGRMIEQIMDNYETGSDGSHLLRVSVIVDLFERDEDEPNFSPCDDSEIDRAICKQERMEREPIKPVFWRSLENGFPNDNVTVLVATDKNIFFFARYHKDKNIWVNEHGDVDYNDAGEPKYWAELPTIKTK